MGKWLPLLQARLSHFSLLTQAYPPWAGGTGLGGIGRETEAGRCVWLLCRGAGSIEKRRGPDQRQGLAPHSPFPTLAVPLVFPGGHSGPQMSMGKSRPREGAGLLGVTQQLGQRAVATVTLLRGWASPICSTGTGTCPVPRLGAHPMGQGLTPPTRCPAACSGRGFGSPRHRQCGHLQRGLPQARARVPELVSITAASSWSTRSSFGESGWSHVCGKAVNKDLIVGSGQNYVDRPLLLGLRWPHYSLQVRPVRLNVQTYRQEVYHFLTSVSWSILKILS